MVSLGPFWRLGQAPVPRANASSSLLVSSTMEATVSGMLVVKKRLVAV